MSNDPQALAEAAAALRDYFELSQELATYGFGAADCPDSFLTLRWGGLQAVVTKAHMRTILDALASPAGEAVQEQPQPVQPCAWGQDGDDESSVWATGCGEYFIVGDGKPSENDMRFCCYCGKPLEEHPMEFEDDEDGIGQLGDTGTTKEKA